MTALSSFLFFVLAIAPLVFIHEMGHYWVGRWCGVRAEVFSIGFGRPLTSWRDRRGTRWQVGWLPLGGYVRFAGDMSPASKPSPEWLALPPAERDATFQSKTLWQKTLIVAAGPAANFLFAIVAFGALFGYFGEPRIDPVVRGVAAQSAAAAAGLRPGDRIVAVDGATIGSFEDIALAIQVRAGQPTPILVERAGTRQTIVATPRLQVKRDRFGKETRHGMLGIAPGAPRFVPLAWYEIPGAAVRYTATMLTVQVRALGQIVTGARSVKEMSGPVGTAQISNEVAAAGILSFLFFMAFISINLGFINLLPIPMLDGGHLAFYAMQAVSGRPPGERALDWAYRAGMAIVFGFMILVTTNDLLGLAGR